MYVPGAYMGQKKAMEPVGMKLQMSVSTSVGAGNKKTGPLENNRCSSSGDTPTPHSSMFIVGTYSCHSTQHYTHLR